MASLENLNETPNLLELAESDRIDLSTISGLSETATCGEKTHWSSPTGHSVRSDDNVGQTSVIKLFRRVDDVPSVCADDPQLEKSVCADD
jgi:hypothetical protein